VGIVYSDDNASGGELTRLFLMFATRQMPWRWPTFSITSIFRSCNKHSHRKTALTLTSQWTTGSSSVWMGLFWERHTKMGV